MVIDQEDQDEFDEALLNLVNMGMVIMTIDDKGVQQFEIAPAGVQALGIKLN